MSFTLIRYVCIFLFSFVPFGILVSSEVSTSTINKIKEQLIKKDKIFNDKLPEYTKEGEWQFREKVNWLSGFIAGELWYLYEMTGDEQLKSRAIEHSDFLTNYSEIDYTHDMGFIFLPSCVKAFEQTGKVKYREAGIKAAEMLAKRFNANGNFIRAWGKLGSEKKAGWMIIDTMMNLELLFWAAKESGIQEYYSIAYKHALTTLNESVRNNYSAYHVVEFDPNTGVVLKKRTHQGYRDESTWARGQAWGIYGFAIAYKYTQDKRFLNASKKMVKYFIERLPSDHVPYWDLDLKGEEVLRDASAAAIAASGMFLLSELSKTKSDYLYFQNWAKKITESLAKNYLFTESNRNNERGILLHTIYNYHKDWGVNESFPAGDYYFVETIEKLWDHEKNEKFITGKSGRQICNINKNWFYLEDNAKDFRRLSKTDKKWQKINLPHTWNVWDVTDVLPGYRRDISWYEKELFIPDNKMPVKYVLYFEGVNIESEIYVNGKKAGEHTGGYVGFEVDITPFINNGELNKIHVKTDNSYNPEVIPSQKSDFFIYGGITRDVWLKVLPLNHIEKIFVKTPDVSESEALTEIKVEVANNSKEQIEVISNLIDPNGKQLFSTKSMYTSNTSTINIELPVLKNPQLWSPDSPNLYTIQVQLNIAGKLVDSVEDKFGYRWYEFKENGPFFLNGKRLLLKGTHRHEEHAGYGNAMPNELHRKDMQMIKDMGANFVRLAHYPQDPEVYLTCDKLGLLVWDELPWCRGGVGNDQWKENSKNMLQEMILQNYNHPSIIMWSVGNEVYWLPDFDDGGNIDSIRAFVKELNDIAHELDPGRVTSIRKFYDGAELVDVFSPSIWAGWYSGVYTNYEKALFDSRNKYKRFFHAEYGGSSHVGRHVENPVSGEGLIPTDGWEEEVNQAKLKNIAKVGDWSESYIVDLFDWHLHVSQNLDWFTGNAQWAFKDFGTPLRPENAIPFVNQKGLVDREGKPKDAYYVFKSYWAEFPKFCYIESHTWTERNGPKGLKREVPVFSNCDEVEFLLNGKTMGRKKRIVNKFPAQGLVWEVEFVQGENKLTAIGYSERKIVTKDSVHLNYLYRKPGKPHKILLSSTNLKSGNILITAQMMDKNGQLCTDYNKRVYFSSDGDGHLLVNYGTPTKSQVIEMANGKAAIEFVPVPGGSATIEARNQDFKGSYLKL